MDHRRMDVGEDHAPAGPHRAGELGDRRADVGAVVERQAADGEVERRVVDGQLLQAAEQELRARHLRAREPEHLRRHVEPHDRMPGLRQMRAHAAGPARRVQGTPRRDRRDNPLIALDPQQQLRELHPAGQGAPR
jgi:hypothetical protein